MKQNWFRQDWFQQTWFRKHWLLRMLGAVALVAGAAWSEVSAVYAVSFEPPSDNAAPRSTTGGASRGSFFTPPPDNAAPIETTGGASRSGVFTPPPSNAAPRSTTGGASRGDFFVPPPNNASPRRSTGGAARGDFFAPPPGEGAPHNTTGGAARGGERFETEGEAMDTSSGLSRGNAYGVTSSDTGVSVPAMIAVMPDSFYGTTVEARPTVLVYVPRSDADEAVFSLKDEAGNTIYEMPVNVPAKGGVMAIEMPTEAPELTVDKNYQWYVAIKLEDNLSPSSPFVDGWVKRIEPNAAVLEALQQRSAIAGVEALGANGIWYDTAARLAKLTEGQSDEVMMNHWYELLESVGLDEIAAAPITL